MADWQHSIVSFLDLIGIKKLIEKGDSSASSQMRGFHQFVQNYAKNKLPLHQKIYFWNDSILFLSNTGDGHSLYEPIMKELDTFKALVDKRWKSFAISVKGKTFPPPTKKDTEGKIVYLMASSYAFTNCFTIEEFGKNIKGKKPVWYVDSRIVKYIKTYTKYKKDKILMQPTGRKRNIFMYYDFLWKSSQQGQFSRRKKPRG